MKFDMRSVYVAVKARILLEPRIHALNLGFTRQCWQESEKQEDGESKKMLDYYRKVYEFTNSFL